MSAQKDNRNGKTISRHTPTDLDKSCNIFQSLIFTELLHVLFFKHCKEKKLG